MRKKLTLSIRDDVYRELQEVPEGVSLSEVATFLFKAWLEEWKKGRELTEKEFDDLFNRTPEDLMLRLKIRQYVKPKTIKLAKKLDKIEEVVSKPLLRKGRRKKG